MIDLNKLDKAFLAEAQKQFIFNLTSQDFLVIMILVMQVLLIGMVTFQ